MQDKMGKTEKNWKENYATKVTKYQKTKIWNEQNKSYQSMTTVNVVLLSQYSYKKIFISKIKSNLAVLVMSTFRHFYEYEKPFKLSLLGKNHPNFVHHNRSHAKQPSRRAQLDSYKTLNTTFKIIIF